MFASLKKKAVSRLEQLKNLDALCDDKQREAAAADAAVAALIAPPKPAVVAEPVSFPLPPHINDDSDVMLELNSARNPLTLSYKLTDAAQATDRPESSSQFPLPPALPDSYNGSASVGLLPATSALSPPQNVFTTAITSTALAPAVSVQVSPALKPGWFATPWSGTVPGFWAEDEKPVSSVLTYFQCLPSAVYCRVPKFWTH